MIPTKARRQRGPKLPKKLERLYQQEKCRDCTVRVTRMDFAKILGKYTKVKIQFESNSSSKSKGIHTSSPNSKLNNIENGMLQDHRSAYTPHSARRTTTNVLKENNRLNKTEKDTTFVNKKLTFSGVKYGIVFVNPTSIDKEASSKISLDTLLPSINIDILPSKEWCIDYFPKNGEPKDDKIYDRIAAELEDLMFNEKTKNNSDNKDEFPSILDILNDNSKQVVDKPNDVNISGDLESSDVEAILLGKSKPEPMEIDTKPTELLPVQNDNTDTTSLSTDTVQKPNEPNEDTKVLVKLEDTMPENPNSPSILDENTQENIPQLSVAEKPSSITNDSPALSNENCDIKNKNVRAGVAQVIFKKSINGISSKTVICPKNLKYSIFLHGQAIELLGAPKFISCLEDLRVLLEIVEESELSSSHVLH